MTVRCVVTEITSDIAKKQLNFIVIQIQSSGKTNSIRYSLTILNQSFASQLSTLQMTDHFEF